jgi:hypothetical protein
VLLALAVLLSGGAAAQSLYKWVDEDGNVVYSQSRPSTAASSVEELEVRRLVPEAPEAVSIDGEAAQPTGAAATPAQSGQAARDGADDGDHEDLVKRNCETARQNLRVLRDSPVVSVQSDDGSVVNLDAPQREAQMQKTNRMIEIYCK